MKTEVRISLDCNSEIRVGNEEDADDFVSLEIIDSESPTNPVSTFLVLKDEECDALIQGIHLVRSVIQRAKIQKLLETEENIKEV